MDSQRFVSDDILRERLRINVRGYRHAASLSAAAAARRVQMHLRHWQKIEAGVVNVTLLTLVRLAVALGVEPRTLLDEPPRRGPGSRGS
jgi:transcriptional regulator with XRE-family HTH domain